MEIFLTENIRLKNDKMEYKDNLKFKPILKRNWHLYLSDYGWEKLPKKWIIKLNKLSKINEKNSLYGSLDCETDGDCFFHCISNALNEKNIKNNNYYDSNDIRKMISENINENQYDIIINYYRIMKDANDFDENWDPYSIESIDDFKNQILISGNEYWGDYLLFQLIINVFNMNIFILNSNSLINDYSVYNTLNEYNPSYGTIFLLYENACHFQLIGYFNGDKIVSYFNHNNIPNEFKILFNLN